MSARDETADTPPHQPPHAETLALPSAANNRAAFSLAARPPRPRALTRREMNAPSGFSETLAYYSPPAVTLAALTFAVIGLLGGLRLTAIRRRAYPLRYFKLMQRPEGADFPAHAEAAGRNLINLFEVPVMFYALVPLLVLSGEKDVLALGFLWGFVGFRVLHTAVHVTVNHLVVRFSLHLLANLALLGAWACFAL